jgi:hypothetical protein
VLGVATGPSEAETFWKGFPRSLADRGLRGVKLVIADDHKGLRAAASRVFHATIQRWAVQYLSLFGHKLKARQQSGQGGKIDMALVGYARVSMPEQAAALRRDALAAS